MLHPSSLFEIIDGQVTSLSSRLITILIVVLVVMVVLMPTTSIMAEAQSSSQIRNPQKAGSGVWQENGILDQNGKNGTHGNAVINLSNNTGHSTFDTLPVFNNRGFMAASANNVYVVWSDNSTGSLGSIDIMLAKSDDSGTTFQKPMDLSFPLRNNGSTAGVSGSPQVAASGNNVFVVWTEFTYGQSGMNLDSAIMYVRSADGGKTFQGPFSITTGCFGVPESTICLPTLAGDARIIAAGDFAYVAWVATELVPAFVTTPELPRDAINTGAAVPAEIWFSKIDSSGSTVPLNISNNTGDSSAPRIALSGSNVYLAWEDDSFGFKDILLRRIVSDATTLEAMTTVNVSNNPLNDDHPEMAASGSSVYLTWQQSGRDRSGIAKSTLVFASSHDNGTTFSTPATIANTKISAVMGPGQSVAVSNSNNNNNNNKTGNSYVAGTRDVGLNVVWTDGSPEGQNVYFASSNGTGSSPFVRNTLALTNTTMATRFAQLAVSTYGVHLVWTENTLSGSGIFFSESNFTARTNSASILGIRDASVYSFSIPVRVTNSTSASLYPLVVSTGDDVYLAWQSKTTSGDWDIFFKKVH